MWRYFDEMNQGGDQRMPGWEEDCFGTSDRSLKTREWDHRPMTRARMRTLRRNLPPFLLAVYKNGPRGQAPRMASLPRTRVI